MKKHLFLLLSLVVLIFAVISSAQEETDTNYSWGTVKSISAGEIVLTEQDIETGEEMEVVYNIDANVALNNVTDISDILVGNSVGIEYEVVDGNRVAKVIDIEEIFGEENVAGDAKTCE
jgi:hypothetical protein